MNLLLDTHTLIWYLEGDKSLSSKAKDLIENTSNEVFVSHISFFEIAIKLKIGKIISQFNVNDYFENTKKSLIEILPISESHIKYYNQLVFFENHKDPFDRLLISAGVCEGFSIISIDSKFNFYNDIIEIIW